MSKSTGGNEVMGTVLKVQRRASGRHGSSSNPPSFGTAGTATASRLRVYKSNSTNKMVTREFAALEFLLGIPMQAEREIVHQGWMQQQGVVEAKQSSTSTAEEEQKVEVLEPPNKNEESNHGSNTGLSSSSHHGRWWEKWVNNPNPSKSLASLTPRSRVEEDELEQPSQVDGTSAKANTNKELLPKETQAQVVPVVHAPGRRLEGDDAIRVQIPLTVDTSVITRQRSIARAAFTKEWELQVAHGLRGASSAVNHNANQEETNGRQPNLKAHKPMLDGRLFFSAGESYPLQVFSLLRYEPKKEEAARRRQKLEARGGGGTQFFIMPARDWRGISYRALLPARNQRQRYRRKVSDALIIFDRFATPSKSSDNGGRNDSTNDDDVSKEDPLEDEDDEEYDVEEEDTYVAGLLDDPDMVQGRHRTVMIGDRVTGGIVSSNIQFVKPELLKADLNKQFRERFDGWEPPKSQRKYIGARVIDGVYTLMDLSGPGVGAGGDSGTVGTEEEDSHQPTTTTATSGTATATPRKRGGSISSLSTTADSNIRMPPSLTLSKIRSIKRQALLQSVKARLEISTVALAIVYFERLCLDCRVDKTNRRLSFAACLLLAMKINEAHVGLVMTKTDETFTTNKKTKRIQSLVRPTKKSSTMFASLLEFFTQEWNISLKHLFAAEWGVFAALQFRLHAKPSQVAFHFKRLLKSLYWNPRIYLGAEMFEYWQEALVREEYLRQERETRREVLQQKKEQKQILQIQRELEAANRREKESIDRTGEVANKSDGSSIPIQHPSDTGEVPEGIPPKTPKVAPSPKRAGSRIGFLNRFSGAKRTMSTDKLALEGKEASKFRLLKSPSMPTISDTFGEKQPRDDFIIDIHTLNDQANNDDEDGYVDNLSIADGQDGAIMI